MLSQPEEEEKVRDHQARLRRKVMHPVKLSRVNKLALFDSLDTEKPKDNAAMIIGEENGIKIKSIWRLGRRNESLYRSVVVYLVDKSEGEVMLQRRMIDVGGETAFASFCERRQDDGRCFRCLQHDHQGRKCQNVLRCRKCSGQGHLERDSKSSTVECLECGRHIDSGTAPPIP